MNLIVKCGSSLQTNQLSLTKDSMWVNPGHFMANVQVYGRLVMIVWFI